MQISPSTTWTLCHLTCRVLYVLHHHVRLVLHHHLRPPPTAPTHPASPASPSVSEAHMSTPTSLPPDTDRPGTPRHPQ